MKVAVVGHIEWVEFARVDHVPEPGEILSAHETWEEAAGGGAVAAVQLANLAGSCLFFTALADDGLGRRSREELERRGVTVHSGQARGTQRRAFTYVDENGERTITVLGEKLRASGEDGSLPWEELAPLTDDLPPKERAAVVLRYGYDLDYDAIGAALGSNEQAARQAASAGVRRLRKEKKQ